MNHLKTALLLSFICTASFSAAIITPALPALQLSYNISRSGASWIVSIFLIGYVIGQLLYGPIAKRFGTLKALRSGLVINLIGILVCLLGAFIKNYHLLLIGRLITALGSASGLSCTFMLMHDYLDDQELKQAMAYSIISFTLGIGFAVLIGGVVTQYLHWQYCFWVLLLHGLLMLALTWYFQKTPNTTELLRPLLILKNYWHALKSTRLIIFSLVVGFISAFSYGYSMVAPLYAHTQLHLTPSVYSYWNSINMVGMLCGGLFSAYLIKRAGAKNLLLIGFLGMLPCCLSFLLMAILGAHTALWFFTTTMIGYFFSGFLFASGSYYASHAIADKANGASMMSFINMLAAVLFVVVVGYLPLPILLSFSIVLGGFFILIIALALLNLKSHAPCN